MVAPETTNKEMKNRQIRRVDRYSAISIIIVDMRQHTLFGFIRKMENISQSNVNVTIPK